jgi:hypothetical protein
MTNWAPITNRCNNASPSGEAKNVTTASGASVAAWRSRQYCNVVRATSNWTACWRSDTPSCERASASASLSFIMCSVRDYRSISHPQSPG